MSVLNTTYTTPQILYEKIRPCKSLRQPKRSAPLSMPKEHNALAIPASKGLMSHAMVSSKDTRAIPIHQKPTNTHAIAQLTTSQF